MSVILAVCITLLPLLSMEAITWLTHKYVMHGFLWFLHEDHHQPNYTSWFEKNDLFFVIFAIPSAVLMYNGIEHHFNVSFYFGLGILIYGICYFLVQDDIIHQRFKWFKNVKWKYIQALRKGHKMHHKQMGKKGSESFGMLLVPWKYFNEKYNT